MRKLAILVVLGGLLVPREAVPYDGKLVSLAVGAKLSNDVVRRGAGLYDGVQASPILYVGFFDHRVQFFVSSLEGNDFLVARVLRARTKISSVSDRPFLRTSGPLTARNARETSWAWTSRLEWFVPDIDAYRGQLDLAYEKDLKAHGGSHAELTGRVTLAKLFPEEGKPRLQPQAFVSVGVGDAWHNAYLYGTGAGTGGFSHIAYGVMIISPARIDPHFPVVQLYRYDLLGDSRRGALVPQISGYHLDVTFAFGIL